MIVHPPLDGELLFAEEFLAELGQFLDGKVLVKERMKVRMARLQLIEHPKILGNHLRLAAVLLLIVEHAVLLLVVVLVDCGSGVVQNSHVLAGNCQRP